MTQVKSKNFIYNIIKKDLSLDKYKFIHTRFPPEPNGYIHIGHAKSICLNFGIADNYQGKCNLRFDDTNPTKEDIHYIDAIQKDIQWLGFNWSGNVCYSSDYFTKFYEYAIELIKKGLAYVDELSPKEIHDYRGTLTVPGINSPYRNRSIEDNLVLFNKMRNGDLLEGSASLRAKIDMHSPFIIMRDPVLYRIKFVYHHRTGNKWCIYPMYDFAQCISDALEGITHSLCTLEFQDNKKLYNWILNNVNINQPHPHQYEFSRLNLQYTVLSKRKLNLLITKKIVEGWDDPRMPTISGLRRKGYPAHSIRDFCYRIGITKQENNIEISLLESCVRKYLDSIAFRIMAVINPVLVIIETLPLNYKHDIIVHNHPYNPEMGTHKVTFSREIYIDRSDFREKESNNYKRLVLGKEVRLRHSYIITAHRIEKNIDGQITSIFCRHDPNTLNKKPTDNRVVKGVIHWVSATHGITAEFRLYNSLFTEQNPATVKDLLTIINPQSLVICYGFIESYVLQLDSNTHFQFEREGYFYADSVYSNFKHLVFNRTVTLRKNNLIITNNRS